MLVMAWLPVPDSGQNGRISRENLRRKAACPGGRGYGTPARRRDTGDPGTGRRRLAGRLRSAPKRRRRNTKTPTKPGKPAAAWRNRFANGVKASYAIKN